MLKPVENSRGRSPVVPLERQSRIAMHRQIAHQLRKAIASGQYGPGDRIPTEPELSEQFAVSRITARQAVEHLVREGIVSRKQGKGSFVNAPLVRHDLLKLQGIYDELIDQGLNPVTELLEYGECLPPPRVAEKLGSREHKVLHWRRLYRLNGSPFGLSSVHLDPAGAAIDRETIAHLSTYEILRTVLQVEIERADVTVRYEPGNEGVCLSMSLPPGTPLMVLERVSSSANGQPREHTLYYAQASSYEFSINVSGPIGLASNLKPGASKRVANSGTKGLENIKSGCSR